MIASIFKEPDDTTVQQILVVNINDKGMECPGMLSEDKVITECESSGVGTAAAAVAAASMYMKTKSKNRLLQQQLSVQSASGGVCSSQASGASHRVGTKKHHRTDGHFKSVSTFLLFLLLIFSIKII